MRRTDFKKALTYTGQKINGMVQVTHKIDGVRILYRDGKFVTRNDKTPPGLKKALTSEALTKLLLFEDCEVYAGSFFESNSPLQRHDPVRGCITADMVYPLGTLGSPDHRLHMTTKLSPTPVEVETMLAHSLCKGYEGLVLRTEDRWYRVKPTSTADVRVTGWFEQYDKNKNPKGQLGGFNTDYGKVTSFTEELRKSLWDNPEQYVGKLMEVQYKELYDTGSFRYAVKFLRFRDDKDEESFDSTNTGAEK